MLEVGSPEWLAFRASRVTATDAGKLWAGSSPAQVVADKRDNSFTGNKYTDWGKAREPVIAGLIQFQYDLEPTDAIYTSAQNDRFMASPDAVGAGLKQVGEYKTVTAKRAWTDVDDMPKQYYGQVQWQLFCVDASSAVFAWEPHTDFMPGPVESFIIHRDDKVIDELIVLAEQVLDLLDKPAEINPVLAEMVQDYLIAKKAMDATRESIENYVSDMLIDSADLGFGSVSYKPTAGARRFDSKAFRAAMPELYDEYVVTSEPGKPVLRITERKIKNG